MYKRQLLGLADGNKQSIDTRGTFIRSVPDGASTRLLISSKGSFLPSQNDTVALGLADQIILLQNVQTDVATLDANNQLIWKAFWV